MEQTYIYGWGKNHMGQLTLQGEEILKPTEIIWTEEVPVMSISTAQQHTIFLCKDGTAYKSGCADGGLENSVVVAKRTRLPNFKRINNIHTSQPYAQVCCAGQSSVATTKWGQVFSWGDNEYCQLGLPMRRFQNKPAIVRSLLVSQIIRVACSSKHTLLLSNAGEIFTFGFNTKEQVELSSSLTQETPRRVSSLKGIPFVFIACGAHHSLAISALGTVYAWGHNEYGQLGLNHTESCLQPTPLQSISSFNISYIACGENFTIFLSKDGGLFSCGCGTEGQLGHGRTSNELLPIKIAELMGSVVTQVACGSTHTLAYVPAKNCIYAFGSGVFGQLGTGNRAPILVPTIITGPWQTKIVKEIFCGAHQSFVLATAASASASASSDLRFYDESQQIVVFTQEIAEGLAAAKQGVPTDPVFSSTIHTLFHVMECWNASFMLATSGRAEEEQNGHKFDFEMATKVFQKIATIENLELKELMFNGITNEIFRSIKESTMDKVDQLRILLMLPLYHEFRNERNYKEFHAVYALILQNLQQEARDIFYDWLIHSPLKFFESLILIFKNAGIYIITTLYEKDGKPSRAEFARRLKDSAELHCCLQFLSSLHTLNSLRADSVSYAEFYWFGLTDFFAIEEDYIEWYLEEISPESFNICEYPFLFDVQAKTAILKIDQGLQMNFAMRQAQSGENFQISNNPFIMLRVTRERIVQETLRTILTFTDLDLKKPLKVQFLGEEAEDAGGVRMEFFRLLTQKLTDPKYSMFKKYENGMLWFSNITFEGNSMYYLIGVLIGLAIYNFTLVNIEFPLALYKKVLDEKPTVEDLCELSPTTGSSLVDILNYQGDDFEEKYDICFEISFDVLGTLKTVPLIQNGHNIAVTQNNKADFVDRYVDFIFNKSVESQFNAFKEGLLKIVEIRVLKLFRPNELMSLVIGTEDYDWIYFQENAAYENGYSEQSETVQFFWQVFHELKIEEKKRFLCFLTGTDRIPLKGMRDIKITIKKLNNVDYLPVAHTCFNILDLPCYQTKERLKFKLKQALEQPQGFSLV